ncbi:MAG: glycoside hydrolase family 92 protein [Deltaproteobacteria bacterium]|nr:glycoside hydrolase family 92 protein [Deltaproteobacteria bacterium]
MTARRCSLVIAMVAAACGGDDAEPSLPEVTDTLAYVDPRIGTGGLGFAHGSSFVGAAVPHGLAKVGPDTSGPFGTVNFLHYSGYWAGDDKIRGFSQVHLHGAGATDYGVLSVMPAIAFDPAKTTVVGYESRFAKAAELAAAGRYEVTLANGIAVALTATPRVAVHRYTGAGAIVIDLAKTLESGEIDAASITVDAAARELVGQLHHNGGMTRGFGGYTVYFVARARTPWTAHVVWSAGSAPSVATTASGTGVGAAIVVDGPVELAIGLSLVSLDGARANLDAEVPVLDFETVATRAREAWADKLDRVRLTGGTEAQRRTFYTSLYHAFLMPSVIDDADGTYVLAGQPPAVATGWHQQSDLSLWDTYRTVHPLYAWLAPESARDAARSLVAFGEGLGIYPKWPLAIGETGVMLGASAEIAIADAVLRGVPGVEAERAWPGRRAAAMDATAPAAGRGGRDRVESYMQYGYVPVTEGRSVSTTTEYAHDDFALAQLAGALGHTTDRDALLARSKSWRKLFDPAVGFLRGRKADGTFPTTTFDPLEMGSDYAEANAWHSLWMTSSHDAEGLAELLGSTEAAIAKLEMFFTLAKHDWDTADESAANFPRPYYWHGNEPDLNAVFVFAQLGRPDLTHEWVRWIEDTMYSDQPEGLAGNDDGGTLGAWYVLATLGVYPIPGSDRWILGAPRFPQARITIGGRELTIVADGLSDRAIYVRAVELDGVAVAGPELTHAQLAGASTLRFVMATSP